ncbi:hypothetical protein LDENG_00229390 [Lucifuga dentata]|nr:hypothetical protein LDENG_00229390 [Lucifuga dentata]
MSNNFLKLSGNKSEVLLIGSKSSLSKAPPFTISIDDCLIHISSQVKKSWRHIRQHTFIHLPDQQYLPYGLFPPSKHCKTPPIPLPVQHPNSCSHPGHLTY